MPGSPTFSTDPKEYDMLATLRKLALAALFLAPMAHAAPLANPVPAPEFSGIDKWLNSEPLTLSGLRGKVVLVDFWTYTCINCARTLPYVKSWHAKYKDQGLVVVGVHTPEFPFERSTKNVSEALNRYGIEYPVAQDNRYATWEAYKNNYWPAFYLIDKQGKVTYTHFGEGEYKETEAAIQNLLKQPG
jgi:thiol-disulfide isomerase/thioredoxin